VLKKTLSSIAIVISVLAAGYLVEAGTQDPYPPPPFAPGSAIRFEITPKEAEVYADGYFAGIVDEFDGVFQRLYLASGQHEITLFRDGFKTVHQTVYLSPHASFKVRYTMQPLAPGEVAEPRPAPPPPPPTVQTSPGSPGLEVQPLVYGTLAVRVAPRSAAVLIDGERWLRPQSQEGLVVQLAEGVHHVEISGDGYESFSSDVSIRQGEMTALNVSLKAR
jgi:PEGA domain-containing protein